MPFTDVFPVCFVDFEDDVGAAFEDDAGTLLLLFGRYRAVVCFCIGIVNLAGGRLFDAVRVTGGVSLEISFFDTGTLPFWGLGSLSASRSRDLS